MSDIEHERSTEDSARRTIAEYRREMREKALEGQRLYARIRESSKYFYQNDTAKKYPSQWGLPFPVCVWPDDLCGYIVKGGPGGQYRLSDVHLAVIENGREVQIS